MSTRSNSAFQPNLSKFVAPSLSVEYVARDRLYKRLNRASRHKFVLLQAPQGYGKISLLSDWYNKVLSPDDRQNTLWYKVDENDAEPSCFWQNIIEALEQQWPGFKEAVEKHLELFEQSTPHELSIAIANRILQSIDPNKRYAVNFLNFERFKLSESESQFFVFAGMLPANVHLFISSRIFLNNRILQMGTYNELVVIGADELALNQDELGAYVKEQLDTTTSDEAIAYLYEKTLGWPLAVDIFLQEVQSGKSLDTVLGHFNGNNQTLSEFIFMQTARQLPSRVFSFLIETAHLKRFSPALCDFVTESHESLDIIEYLVRNGIFTFTLDSEGQWFRYHPLFADWLRSQSLKLRRDQLRALNHRAGQWYRDKDMYLLSTRHIIAASEGDFVIRLANVVFSDQDTDQTKFVSWLYSLNESEFETNAQFSLLAAWAYVFTGRPIDTYRWCKNAQQNVQGEMQIALLELCAKVLDAKCYTLKGDHEKGIELSKRLLSDEGPLLDDILKMVLYQNLGEAYEQVGDIDQALKQFQKAMTIARINQFEFLTGFTRYQVLCLLYRQSQFAKAEELCWLIISECSPDFTVYGATYALLGLMMLEQNNFDRLELYINRAFSRVSSDRNIDIYIEVCVSRSLYLMTFQMINDANLQLAAAIAAIRHNEDVPPRGVGYLVFAMQARLYLNQNDVGSAEEAIAELKALKFPQTALGDLNLDIIDVRIAIAKRQGLQEAAAKLDELALRSNQMSFNLLYVEILILQAVVFYHLEENATALKYLKKALGLAKKELLVRVFLAEGEVIRILLLELVSSSHLGLETERFIHNLIKAFDEQRSGDKLSNLMLGDTMGKASASSTRADERITSLWNLTNRELEVMRLLQKGLNRKDIAHEFCTSQNTVKTHIAHIYEKIGVHSLSDLMRALMENGVFQ